MPQGLGLLRWRDACEPLRMGGRDDVTPEHVTHVRNQARERETRVYVSHRLADPSRDRFHGIGRVARHQRFVRLRLLERMHVFPL